MYRDTQEYRIWKIEVQQVLDNLVAQNFEKLCNAGERSNYNKIWGGISRELYQKYGLLEDSKDKVEYERQQQQRHYLSVAMGIYSEEEFPWELSDSRTHRFVKQYGKLPKQLLHEWHNFELEERVRAGIERRKSNGRVRLALQSFENNHPEYSHK